MNDEIASSRVGLRVVPMAAFRAAAAWLFLCMVGGGSVHAIAAEQGKYLTGRLLVATPEMRDPRFVETVLYVVRHDEHGAMAVVVNRPLARGPIADLLKAAGIEDARASGEVILHYGGPVEPQNAFILHSDDYLPSTSKRVQDGIAFTTDPEMLRAIALGKGPKRSLLALGYAGWAPGQLEEEIKAEAWFSIPAEIEIIFGENAEEKWERAMDKRQIPL